MTKEIHAAREVILKGVRTVLLGNGFSKLLLISFELLLARALGASDFGLYAVTLSVLGLASTFCLFGMNFGAIQFLAIYQQEGDKQKQASIIASGLAFVSILGVMAAIILGFASGFLAGNVFSKPGLAPALLITAFIVPVEAANLYLSAVFRGLRRFAANVVVLDLLKNILLFCLLPLFLIFKLPFEVVLAVYQLGAVAGLVTGLYLLKRQGLLPGFLAIKWAAFSELFRFSRLLFLWNALIVMSSRILIVGAGIFLTSEETGMLALVVRFTLFMIFFQTAVNSTVQAEFAAFWNKKERDIGAINHLYQSVSRGLLGIAGGVAFLFLAGPADALRVFGGGFTEHSWIVWPILLAEFSNVATGPAGQILVATGKQKLLTALTVFDVVLQFLLVIPLMAFFGIAGAVWGEALRGVLFVAARLFMMNRKIGIHPFSKSYFAGFAVWLVALLAGLLFDGYFPSLTAMLVVYAVGALAVILKTPDIRDEIKILLNMKH